MSDPHIELIEGENARHYRDDFVQIYEAAFADPPYCKTTADVEENFARFDRQTTRPGFRAVLARDESGTPAAMAYGHALSAGTGWWDTLTDPVDEPMRREDGARTFGLFELAVRPEHQREGLATAVHAALVDGLPHERILLNARPDATAAIAAYKSWGYEEVGRNVPWDGAVTHVVLVRNLHP